MARKTVDIATQHPDYSGTGTHGNKLDAAVLHEFLANPDQMAATAAVLRSLAATAGRSAQVPELDLEDVAADEGGLLERHHLARERNPQLRRKKITAVRKTNGSIACEVCGFDFECTYGDRGTDFIDIVLFCSTHRQRLQTEFHNARKRAGLTPKQATLTGCSVSKMLRVETEIVVVSVIDLRALLACHDIDDEHLATETIALVQARPPHQLRDKASVQVLRLDRQCCWRARSRQRA